MKLTVLGCYGPYPPAGGACSGYLLQQGNTKLLMDAGAGVLSRLWEHTSLDELSAVWISHFHFDHTSDLLALRYLLEERGRTLRVYAHPDDSVYCGIVLNHPLLDVVKVDEGDVVKEGELAMQFYKMDHPAPDYAVKVNDRFLYTGDTRMNPNLYNAMQGVEWALADCAKPVGFTGPHMGAEHAFELRRKTGVKLLATHFSPTFDPSTLFQEDKGIVCVKKGGSYQV